MYDKGELCSDGACNSDWGEFGAWVFGRFSFDFCGDMIWSGHTERVMVGLISITRILADKYGDEWYATNKVKIFAFSGVYLAFVVYLMLSVHFHYTVDIALAIMVTSITMTHDRYLAFGVMFFEEYKLFPPGRSAGSSKIAPTGDTTEAS